MRSGPSWTTPRGRTCWPRWWPPRTPPRSGRTWTVSRQRAVIKTLMTVTLHSPGRGRAARSTRPRSRSPGGSRTPPDTGQDARAPMPGAGASWRLPAAGAAQEERERVTLLAGQGRGGIDQPGDVGIQAGLHGHLRSARRGRGVRRAGCAWPGASMTRLVPDGRLGCPSGSSSPVPVFTAMLVPWHDLKLRICGRAANQRALS